MEGLYDITLGSDVIGQARVTQQGLYYLFDCRCRLTGEVLYRLVVRCGDRKEDLGICIPRGGQFGLETKLPVKRFGRGAPKFSVVPRHETVSGQFIPIRPEAPFAYLSRLEEAFLAVQNGQIGVILPQEKDS